jgi:hypothetical protein
MRFFIIFIILIISLPLHSSGQNGNALNYDKSLRIDFVISGDVTQQQITIDKLLKAPTYSSSKNQNISPYNYGSYRLLMINKESNDTLFIKGFCTLFEEWQTTKQAKHVRRAFKQTIEMPFPQKTVLLIIEHRKKDNHFTPLLSESFNPHVDSYTTIVPSQFKHKLIYGSDNPDNQTDILLIAEGYTKDESEDFFSDARNMTDYFLSVPPYDELKNRITIRALAVPSKQSGTDDPSLDRWKNTALKSSFNTFGTDRYLQSMDTWTIYDYAALLPHDHIVVLVNTNKYGGGGVYNHFSITSAKHNNSEKVFIHEIGHGLSGLADEYYYANAEFEFTDYYDLETEPWHPNITTLIDFSSKWEQLLNDSVPIPTPAVKKYKNSTGVFEGAGYVAKKIYRPALNCKMKSNEAEGFCEVCRESIKKVIIFQSK